MSGLLLVSGPPGSGKSTLARLLVSGGGTPAALVDGDAFFGFVRDGVDPWRPEAHVQNIAVTEAAAAAAGRLAREMRAVYDGLVGPWFVTTFLRASGLDRLDYVVLLPDEGTCVNRVRRRTGHGFTDLGATRAMHREFVAATVDPRHVIVDPQGTPDDLAALVRHRLSAGRLTVRA